LNYVLLAVASLLSKEAPSPLTIPCLLAVTRRSPSKILSHVRGACKGAGVLHAVNKFYLSS